MSDLICELVKETDPFLREKPETFNFESPQVDPEKLSAQLIENMIHHEGYGLSANQIGIPVSVFAMKMEPISMKIVILGARNVGNTNVFATQIRNLRISSIPIGILDILRLRICVAKTFVFPTFRAPKITIFMEIGSIFIANTETGIPI